MKEPKYSITYFLLAMCMGLVCILGASLLPGCSSINVRDERPPLMDNSEFVEFTLEGE